MSSKFSPAFQYVFGKEQKHTLMLGLDSAGKTAILSNLKLGEVISTMPDMGFNVERMKSKTIGIISWDLGNQVDDLNDKQRALRQHYYQTTENLIFVVDSADHQRIKEARQALHQLLSEVQLKNAHLLIYANKKDLLNAMDVTELTDKLDLHSLNNRQWYVQTSCALTGDGLFEGLDWLSKQTKSMK